VWVLTRKEKNSNNIYRERRVINRVAQVPDRDFEGVFSPTFSRAGLQIFLSFCVDRIQILAAGCEFCIFV
jgi:hypothetical protein